MKDTGTTFERLALRDEFNASVRHIKGTIAILDRFEAGENLADLINEQLADKTMIQDEVPMVVSMIIGQKHPYVSVSANIHSAVADPSSLSDAVKGWHAADLVLVYQHPDLGILVLNPKNADQMAGLDRFARNECITVYAGTFGKPARAALMLKAAKDFIELVEGSSKKADSSLKKGACVYKAKKKKSAQPAQAPAARRASPGKKAAASVAPSIQVSAADVMAAHARGSAVPAAAVQAAQAPAAAPIVVAPSGVVKMTPMYAVLVTNELFHNGNVEAWKRIIASYNAKHPSLQVCVYYDGERITNLNSLFTWGKVKRGTCIEFKVVGEEIVDVAKLQRYLKQGASHMFEAFLKFPVNTIPQLF